MKALIVILTILATSYGKGANIEENCELNNCYSSVNSSHDILRNLLGEGQRIVDSTKFPSSAYFNFSNLLNKTVDIENELLAIQITLDDYIPHVVRCHENYTVNINSLKDLLNKLRIGSNYTEFEEMFKEKLKYFENIYSINQIVVSICGNASNDYVEFESVVNELFNDFSSVKDQINRVLTRTKNSNKNSDTIFEETITSIDQFNELQILQDIAEHYIIEAEANINKSLINLQNSRELLYDYLKDLYKNRSGEIEKKVRLLRDFIDDLQNIVTIMEKSVKLYDEAISRSDVFSILDVNKALVKEITENIETLIKKIETFQTNFEIMTKKFEEEKNRVFKVIKQSIASVMEERKNLVQYNLFLDLLLLSEGKIRMIETEIRKVEYTIALINQKKKLKLELDEVKKIYNELVKQQVDGICLVDVTFEN